MEPVRWLDAREPWDAPQYLPGQPHNLPARPDPAVALPSTSPGFPDQVAVREAHRYASLVDISITVGTSSFKFLDAPIGKRNMLGFRNASTAAQVLYIAFNGPASSTSWLALTAGTIVLFDSVVPQDDLYAVSSAAGGVLSYMYSTFPG